MGELDDAVSGLSPEERKQWMDQFGPLPAYSSDTAVDTTPRDVTVSPMPVQQAGQQIQDADANRSYAQGIPVKPPPPGYENSGGSWEVDDDGKERFYAPVQQAAPATQAAADAVPAAQGPRFDDLPRSTDIDDLKDYVKRMEKLRDAEHEEHKPTASTDRVIRKAEEQRMELAVGAPEGKTNATTYGNVGNPIYAAEGEAYTQARLRREHERENRRRFDAGLPTIEEEARKKARAKAMPVPGGGHVIFGAAVPGQDSDYDENGVGKIVVNPQRQAVQAQPNVGPGEGAGSDRVMPDKAQGSLLPSWQDYLTMGPDVAKKLGQSFVDRLTTVPDDPTDHQPGVGGTTQTLGEFTPGEPTEEGRGRSPINYPPAQYIPGKRTPAAWSVTEGQQVPLEDQEAMAQARTAQRAAIEVGRQTGVDRYTAEAQLAANQQKATADIDAMNRKRQLDHQAALRVETDKLAKMTQSIRDRSLDDEQMFALPGAAGQFFAAIGQALGAGAAARTGGVNHAAEYVKGRINEIVQKQKMQADKDKNTLSGQENLIAQMRKLYGDDELGDQAAKIAYTERAKLQAQEQAATSKAQGVNANALMLAADLEKDQAHETTAFHLMALDKIQRHDVMTKTQVIGGPPPGSRGEGEEAEPGKVVRLGDYSLAGHPANTDLVLQSPSDRKEATSVISAHSTIMSTLDDMEAMVKAHPWLTYGNVEIPGIGNIAKTKEYQDYMKKVETITTMQGELRGQTRMPNQAELEKMYNYWAVSPLNAVGGSSILDKIEGARQQANTTAAAKIKTFAPNVAERGIGVNEKGQIRPVETYTGETMYTRPLPKSAKPVDGTGGGSQRRDIAPLDLSKPKLHHITTRTSKGGKKSEDVGPSSDDGADDDGG